MLLPSINKNLFNGRKQAEVPPIGGGTYTVNGSGFGTGPTVLLYDNYADDTVGQLIGTSANIGTWDSSHVTGKTFPVLENWSGRRCFSMHDATGGNAYGLRRGSLTPYNKFLQFHKFGIPTGKTFPGGIAESDSWSGSPSSCKMVWHVDNNDWRSGGNTNADIIFPSHVGGGDFTNSGNSLKGGQSNDSWPRAWGGWNNYIAIFFDDSPTTGYIENIGFSTNAQRDHRLTSNIDVFDPSVGYGGSIGARQFNGVEYAAWSGNGDNSNTQLMFGPFYLATGDNCIKYILLGNNASLDLCTDVEVVPPSSWTDTQITFDTPSDSSFSNYFIMSRNTILQSGTL